jgi:hypothetical protein
MTLDTLFHLLQAARQQCGHSEYVVIGSLSVLGMSQVSELPKGMTMSIDVDAYTRADPARALDLVQSLGEGSPYHHAHGVYFDPVSPALPALPAGWEQRLIEIEREGLKACFIEPNDAAISKLARGEPRDVRWVRAGLQAGLISKPMLLLRLPGTDFLDAQEASNTKERIHQL